ncbi:UNVERIFIED_CONTAM: hypothetical protein PYX00_000480 [Menopon gallinae]|uniref:INO80 complex subunit F domain-containing protein n=1 Tax=Menopon gallinae TaxID=328185 RepID=A0AAW2IBB5_9NEOP
MLLDDQGMLTDESEDEGAGESHEELTYRRKYQMLLERCEVLQQDNERLVHRIQQVYKYTRQVRKERKFLMDRLDNYGDNWRQGITQYIHDDGLSHLRNISKQKQNIPHSVEKQGRKTSGSIKRSKEKTDQDTPGRKHTKDASKHTPKNITGYNFLP